MARKSKQDGPGLGREVASVAGIFLAAFLLLCLLSYSHPQGPAPSWQSGNWGGAVGAALSHLLMSFFGVASFWLPILGFVFAVRSFSPALTLEDVPLLAAGFTGTLLASSGLFGTLGIEFFTVLGRQFPAGGYLGSFLAVYAAKLFGGPGSLLLFLVLLLLSFMLTCNFSLYAFACKVGGLVRPRSPLPRRVPEAAGKLPADEEDDAGQPLEPERGDEKSRPRPRVHEPVQVDEEVPAQDFQVMPPSGSDYQLPSLGLLDRLEKREFQVDRDYYYTVSTNLEEKLRDFGVEGKVVGISPGPVITTYEFAPAPGVKINRVVALADDLALGLKAPSVRIIGSIPGKAALGIEIPNPERHVVPIRDILAHEKFQKSPSRLTIGLGMDVVGHPVVADLAKMPHLLIAGATGSGKSVAVNTIISSILFKATPDEVRLLLIDPKRIELSSYENIPHLLHPVVVDPKMASRALLWAVREMERRYQVMEEARVKNLASYNDAAGDHDKLPLIVIIIDELADLMMVSSREVEDAVARLAQMARAAGMHLILATQRPSVDVLTGLIKANFPTRMSFKVSSKIDSRTILDMGGAEHLLGAGDMLFMPPGSSKLQRIHGAYISEKETARLVDFLKGQGTARYDESVLKIAAEAAGGSEDGEEELDEKYDEAVAMVCETGQASISMLQRRLRVGYNRAARMIEVMEKEGVVGPADGSKPREVLARKSY